MPESTQSGAVAARPRTSERVGRFEMTVVVGEPTPESEELWNGRASTLARWLVAEWHRERDTEGVT